MLSSLDWTWDPNKNRENLIKHGIRFETAIGVFLDLDFIVKEDPYPYEQRWRIIGTVESELLMVVYTLP